MVCVQKFGFSPSVLHLAKAEQCSLSGHFRSRLPQNREQILLWKILTIFPILSHRVFYFVTTQKNFNRMGRPLQGRYYHVLVIRRSFRPTAIERRRFQRLKFSNNATNFQPYRNLFPVFLVFPCFSKSHWAWCVHSDSCVHSVGAGPQVRQQAICLRRRT